jgi:hypothetical protein
MGLIDRHYRRLKGSIGSLVYSLPFITCLLLGYFLSYIFFVRAHVTSGLLGPPGQAVTSVYLALPDTKVNRALYTLYWPLDRVLSLEGEVVWEKP